MDKFFFHRNTQTIQIKKMLAQPGHICTKAPTVRSFLSSVRSIKEQKIDEMFDRVIRPAIKKDGGDIIFHGMKKGFVVISVEGVMYDQGNNGGSEDTDELNQEIFEILQPVCNELEGVRNKYPFDDL